MAEDDTIKRQNYAMATIDAVKRLMRAREELFDIVNSIAQEGLVYQQADFDGHAKLQHLTPAEMTAVASSIDALNTWLTTTNHEDNLYRVVLQP